MVSTLQQIVIHTENSSKIEIKYAGTESDIIFTKELIECTLDKYTGDILNFNEVKTFVENKNILCAWLEGKLCGFLQFEIKNNVIWLGHIAVAPEFRGKKVANELVKAFIINNAVQPSTRYQLWVRQDNFGAMALYQKFGFIYGNKSSASMLKINN